MLFDSALNIIIWNIQTMKLLALIIGAAIFSTNTVALRGKSQLTVHNQDDNAEASVSVAPIFVDPVPIEPLP